MIGRDILGIEDLSREDIETILETAERMQEIGTREVKKVPTLRGAHGDQPLLRAFDSNADEL